MPKKNYYDVLGVPKTVSADKLNKVRNKLKAAFHPELFPTDADWQQHSKIKIDEIEEAYYVLSDPVKRAEYDRTLSTPKPIISPNSHNFGILSKGKKATQKFTITNLGKKVVDPPGLEFSNDCFEYVIETAAPEAGYCPIEISLTVDTATLAIGERYSEWFEVDLDGVTMRAYLTLAVEARVKASSTPPAKPKPVVSSSTTSTAHSSTSPRPSTVSAAPPVPSPSYSAGRSGADIEADKLFREFFVSIPTYFVSLAKISFIGWLIVGTGACLNRFANAPFRPEDAGYGNNRLFKYIFAAYLNEGLVVVGIVFALGTILIFFKYLHAVNKAAEIRSGKKSSVARTTATVVLAVVILVLGGLWGIPKIANILSGATNIESSSTTQYVVNANTGSNTSSAVNTVTTSKSVNPVVISSGQSPRWNHDGRLYGVYELAIPKSDTWIRTSLELRAGMELRANFEDVLDPEKLGQPVLLRAGTFTESYSNGWGGKAFYQQYFTSRKRSKTECDRCSYMAKPFKLEVKSPERNVRLRIELYENTKF